MTAKSLLQVRIAVRDRARVSAKDPRYNDDVVNRSIQQAYGEVETFLPGGWWWNRVEVSYGSVNGEVPLVMGPGFGYIEGVAYVYASTDGDYWQPIRRRTRTDAIRAGGGQTAEVDIPESWGVEYRGSFSGGPSQLVLTFEPPMVHTTQVRVGLNVVADDLANDTDLFSYLPVQFTGAIVERASARLIRTRREVGNLTTRRRYVTAATLCDTAYEGWMKALRLVLGKPYGGPGYAKQHWRG